MQNIWCFHIEPVRGCTRNCDFCGMFQIKKEVKKPSFMELKLAENIAKQISVDFKEKLRIDFSLHGEPLLHPEIYKLISTFRKNLPFTQLSLITNGDKIHDGTIDVKKLFDSGLNFLMVDEYDRTDEQYNKLYENIYESKIQIHDYFKDKKSIWMFNSHTETGIILVKDLKETKVVTREIHTAGGNLNEKLYEKYGVDVSKIPLMSRCGKPFTEMSINFDGNISLCCEDWRRKNSLGNIKDERLIDIWDSEQLNKYRYLLYNKRRDLIEICSKCNQKSFRTGFLKIENEYPELLK